MVLDLFFRLNVVHISPWCGHPRVNLYFRNHVGILTMAPNSQLGSAGIMNQRNLCKRPSCPFFSFDIGPRSSRLILVERFLCSIALMIDF